MILDWEKFKSAMGCFEMLDSIQYIDEKGREVPIENDNDFQEALRAARLNNNLLKLILNNKNATASQKICIDFSKPPKNAEDFEMKENTCHCNGDSPPKWFTHYMKKFKKDLLSELRSVIFEVIGNELQKERKGLCVKSDSVELFGEKSMFPPVIHLKKKKKVSEKEGLDFSEHRDLKLLKKLEKLPPTKFERLEKLDNKSKLLQEEKKKLLEKKRYSKSRLEKNSMATSEKNLCKKSASFRKNEENVFLTAGKDFILNVHITNDGKLSWSSPRLECFHSTGLFFDEVIIALPKLHPDKSCIVTLRGKTTKTLGLNYFKCRIIDETEKISPDFTFCVRIGPSESVENGSFISDNAEEINANESQPKKPSGKLIDFDKDIIASSEKKIQQNIMEIKKRLQYIDLLRPSTSGEENNSEKRDSTEIPDGCDLLQNVKEKEKNWTKRLEQEEVTFGLDCLKLDFDSNELDELKKKSQMDENEKDEDIRKMENYSSSNSELSVIFMSEEDGNFVEVPLPSVSPSPSEFELEDKICITPDSEDKYMSSKESTEPVLNEDQHSKPEIINNIGEEDEEECIILGNLSPTQLSPTRTRRSPFDEEIPKSKSKKIKSRSTEYRFTADNLTQSTYSPISHAFYTERPSRFTFTGEKTKMESSENMPEFTFTAEKEVKNQKGDVRSKNVPITDAQGKTIYAVSRKGYCLSVSQMLENGEHSMNFVEEGFEAGDQETPGGQERQCDDNEISKFLPNALMNKASNVASLAFNTAKFVINNLQSAFVIDGGKEKVSMKNLLRLYEMGFSDLQQNRKLLIVHDNDIEKVIEELVQMEENSSTQFE